MKYRHDVASKALSMATSGRNSIGSRSEDNWHLIRQRIKFSWGSSNIYEISRRRNALKIIIDLDGWWESIGKFSVTCCALEDLHEKKMMTGGLARWKPAERNSFKINFPAVLSVAVLCTGRTRKQYRDWAHQVKLWKRSAAAFDVESEVKFKVWRLQSVVVRWPYASIALSRSAGKVFVCHFSESVWSFFTFLAFQDFYKSGKEFSLYYKAQACII